MTRESEVEQGMHLENNYSPENEATEHTGQNPENLTVAIDAVADQIETYKDAGMTQISGWLE